MEAAGQLREGAPSREVHVASRRCRCRLLLQQLKLLLSQLQLQLELLLQ